MSPKYIPASEDVANQQRLAALRKNFQTTGRIITEYHDLTVDFKWDNKIHAPAYSSKHSIVLNSRLIPDMGKVESLILMMGLNYHEMAHVMFSPAKSQLGHHLSIKAMDAYRILEEHRIETRFVSMYRKSGSYLITSVVKYFIEDKTQWDYAFLFTHGRKYLPREIRDSFRKIFEDREGPAITRECADIIDKFRVIGFDSPKDYREARDLIYTFADILSRIFYTPPNPCTSVEESGGNQTDSETSRKVKDECAEKDEEEKEGRDSSGFRKEVPQSADTEDEEEDTDVSDSSEDLDEDSDGESESGNDGEGADSESEEDEPGETEGSSSAESEDPGSPDSSEEDGGEGGEPTESGDSDSGAESKEEPTGEQGTGSGGDSTGPDPSGSGEEAETGESVSDNDTRGGQEAGTKGGDTPYAVDLDKLADAIQDVLDDIREDESVISDIEDVQAAMSSLDNLDTDLPLYRGGTDYVTPAMRATAEASQEALQQLWAQLEPGWNFGASEGRLNMGLVAKAWGSSDFDAMEDVYDEWDEGNQDNSGIDAHIDIDCSFSMSKNDTGAYGVSRITAASQVLWMLLYCLRAVEAEVTACGFGSDSFALYEREEVVHDSYYKTMPLQGDTLPAGCLRDARRILGMSDKKHKMLIVVTDGQWGAGSRADVKVLESTSALKVAVLVGNDVTPATFNRRDHFDMVFHCRKTETFFDVIVGIVTKMIERSIGR